MNRLLICTLFLACHAPKYQNAFTVKFDTVPKYVFYADTTLSSKTGVVSWQRGYDVITYDDYGQIHVMLLDSNLKPFKYPALILK